ncbi:MULTISPECIES: hypothetical protein [unclassified Kitasatospora]
MSQTTHPTARPDTPPDRLLRRLPATAPAPEFRLIGLDDLLNNRAATTPDDLDHGRLNAWGNSFPAGELPAPGSLVEIAGIPFAWPNPRPDGDNVRCEGQLIALPPGQYDWIHLLAASERRSEDTIWAHYADGHADPLPVRVSDFLDGTPEFGELPAFRTTRMHYPHHVQQSLPTTMWLTRIGMPRRATATALRLPRLVALHVFALTVLTGTAAGARTADGTTA